MKTVINVSLAVIIVVLGYLLIDSIMNPIRFDKEKNQREEIVKERLIDIRTAQVAYKSKFGRYTGSFDTLISFVKYDSFPLIYKKGSITDEMIEKGITTEREALKRGLIVRDTSWTPVFDSLFAETFPIDSIRYVPGIDNTEFNIGATAIVTGSKVVVQVFEASVLNDVFLVGLDRQMIINYNSLRTKITGFPGMRVGNIREPNNNAGNWEN